jgi:putative N6-adenine-specific DNA methylase
MCGSGTFVIEAAWIATDRPPGLTRKWFGFMGWPDFDRPLWNAIREDARRRVKSSAAVPVRGSDARSDAIQFARQNAKAAGVGHLVAFERQDAKDARPPADVPGVILCNPPYGERIGEERELAGLYRMLGESVAAHWADWRLFVFTSNDWLAKQVGLKVARALPFYNGSLACKLWEFQLCS